MSHRHVLFASLILSACSSGTGPGAGDAAGPRLDAAVAVDAGGPVDAGPPPMVCGDLICVDAIEDCESCALDCGECPTCDMAPTCTGALAVPTSTEPLAGCENSVGDEDRTNYACGTELGVAPSETTCADPQLRLRVRQMSIRRGFFDIERQLYCLITAEDGAHSELLVTPLRDVAGNRMTTNLNLPLAEALFWGQGDLYRSTANLTITYTCYLSSDNAATQAAIDAIADRAGDAAEHADGYGWVFGTVSVLGEIIGSSLGAVSDDLVLDVQQTIDASALLDMTNGRSFEIRERRGNLDLSGASDLRITVESWGCADVRTSFD